LPSNESGTRERLPYNFFCHPERSRGIPMRYLKDYIPGFLDFARNDSEVIRRLLSRPVLALRWNGD